MNSEAKHQPATIPLKTITRVLAVILVVMLVVFAVTAWLTLRHPADTILRGVRVHTVDVSGLTVDEAVAALIRRLPAPETLGIDVQVAGRVWHLTWAEAGQQYDVLATAQAAYAVGRDADGKVSLLAGLREQNAVVPPVIVPADSARVHDAVARIAAAVEVAPADARLTFDGGNVVAMDGQPGQRLDVDAAVDQVLQALAEGASSVELALAAVPPDIATPEPARTQVQAWLARPFTLVVDDPLVFGVDLSDKDVVANQPLTGYYAEFAAPPERIATWFAPRPSADGIYLSLLTDPVRAWIAEIAPQLDANRLLDVEATAQNVFAALYLEQHQAEARIRHPDQIYVVQPGDTLSLIAYNHFMPRFQIEHANPDVDPGAIDVGQEIIIPSIDTLLPYPLAPGKRIEIDLPEQQMRVFEDNMQIYTFTVSSGISRTPTIPGQFQILFKEEAAFAQRWRLDMPYFMGVYEEDEGFFNGIHELPITHYGTRLSRGVLGYPASFGCIIVDEGDAKTLYDWAEVGTLVRITGYAPGTPTWQQTLADLAPLTSEEGGEGP
jgi:hypothetical protein